ncbi:MAG: adenylyltransferase/cytidyltransferase family protein [Verrucomicrobiae bacterium]|nr:adenylyltransferase/cytidyltransferase family protein [Verrucomicrobiae bacterium]
MSSESKVILPEALPAWRERLRAAGRRLVVTNGCFDLLHVGHVHYLEAARALGDALLVGVNGDDSVRQLKGPDRPLNSEQDRMRVLAALACVDGVSLFTDKRATRFLTAAQPDLYVKGGDYTVDTMDPDERAAIEAAGGQIRFLSFVPGRSTTELVNRLRGATPASSSAS